MKLLYKVCLLHTLDALLVAVVPNVLDHCLGGLEFEEGAQDVAGEGSRPPNTTPTMQQHVALALSDVRDSPPNHVGVPLGQVFGRGHLHDGVLEEVDLVGLACFGVFFDVAADGADFYVGDQTNNHRNIHLPHSLDIGYDVALVGLAIAARCQVLTRAL